MSPFSLMFTGNTSGQSASVSTRLHEAVGDQQRQVELAQAAVFALGADEVLDVRVGDSNVPICAPRRPPADDT
jgi:hypothetical protein